MPSHKPTEQLTISYIVNNLDDGWTTMSAQWEKNAHPVGLFVKYGPGVSHKYAYSILQGGVWKAMQSPDSFDISREKFAGNKGNNPEPYAILTEEPEDA